jgi:UDP-N-acetylglucosamine 2-epimerase
MLDSALTARDPQVKSLVTIVGARPQFIKAAPLSAALSGLLREVLVHTGQHYDTGMSEVFFAELGLLPPAYHLGINGGSHGAQTGAMLAAIEDVLLQEQPSIVLVYGDTNSTLAGALAAAKLCLPIAHVEAGLRSFNRAMPEEINRVVTDHLSTWLFAPSEVSRQQLECEGITQGVHVVGDIMYDAVLHNRQRAATISRYPTILGLGPREYYLCTIHRAENTDNEQNLRRIFQGLDQLDRQVILPLHPRTRKRLQDYTIQPGRNIVVLDPVGYFDMLQLQRLSACVLTDSGGVQKEAYYLEVPCVTLRNETEWVETVSAGWNRVVGTDPDTICQAARHFAVYRPPHCPLYGTGQTAQQIVNILCNALEK